MQETIYANDSISAKFLSLTGRRAVLEEYCKGQKVVYRTSTRVQSVQQGGGFIVRTLHRFQAKLARFGVRYFVILLLYCIFLGFSTYIEHVLISKPPSPSFLNLFKTWEASNICLTYKSIIDRYSSGTGGQVDRHLKRRYTFYSRHAHIHTYVQILYSLRTRRLYIEGLQKSVSHISSQPSKMQTYQNNFNGWRVDLHDLESRFNWPKGFKDWLEMGISANCLAFTFLCPVLNGLNKDILIQFIYM